MTVLLFTTYETKGNVLEKEKKSLVRFVAFYQVGGWKTMIEPLMNPS